MITKRSKLGKQQAVSQRVSHTFFGERFEDPWTITGIHMYTYLQKMFSMISRFPHAREGRVVRLRQRQRRRPLLLQPACRTFSCAFQKQRQHEAPPKAFSTAGSLAGPVRFLSAIPVTATCPESTCKCAPTPTPPMPDGLSIDTVHPLNGTMAAYTQQVLIATGRPDWASRIEEDGQGESWGALAKGLKGLLGRGGKYADVRRMMT
jgi:hypothetical protein